MRALLFCSHSLYNAYFVPFSTVFMCLSFLVTFVLTSDPRPCTLCVWNLILLSVDTTQPENKFCL